MTGFAVYRPRKLPTVEAIQFVTNNDDGSHIRSVVAAINAKVGPYAKVQNPASHDDTVIYLYTSSGRVTVMVGDWVLVYPGGECVREKPDWFASVWERA